MRSELQPARKCTEQQDPMAWNVPEAKRREERGIGCGLKKRKGFWGERDEGRGPEPDLERFARAERGGRLQSGDTGHTLGGGQHPPSRPARQQAGPPQGHQGPSPPSTSVLPFVTRSPLTLRVVAWTEGS